MRNEVRICALSCYCLLAEACLRVMAVGPLWPSTANRLSMPPPYLNTRILMFRNATSLPRFCGAMLPVARMQAATPRSRPGGAADRRAARGASALGLERGRTAGGRAP